MNKLLIAISIFLLTTNQAFAQDAQPPSGGFGSFLPLIFIVVLFYFLILRPQLKQQKEHKNLITSIKRNDVILLSTGIEGVVTKIDETNKRITVRIAENVEVKVAHDTSSVREVIVSKSLKKSEKKTTSPKKKTATKTKKAANDSTTSKRKSLKK